MNANVPTLAERILAHLVAYPTEPDAASVPREVTQEGIAEALGARVAHVSRALKGLIEHGAVTAHLAHPKGSKRRSRAYVLTDGGYRAGKELRERFPPTAPPRPAPRAAAAEVVSPPAGRGREFERLVALLDAASRAGPRAALVEGDAGVGKTRLLRALAAEAERRGARVLAGRAVPVGEEQVVGPVAAALAPVGFEARFRARTAGAPRERAMAAAVEALTVASRAAPVVLELDDLHLAGPSVAEFLHGLVRALPPGARVLVLAAFRREEAWELPNGPLYTALMPLRAEPHAEHLELGPLDRDGVAALLADAGVTLDGALVDRVARESGGNPLYVLAMAEAFADGVDEEDFFPKAVEAVATERFRALPPDALEVLQLAAVLGPEFRYPLIARAHGGEELALVGALDVLLDRLLLEEAPASDDGDLTLRFEHPKVREAVLAGLSAPRRRLLETRAAEAHAPEKA